MMTAPTTEQPTNVELATARRLARLDGYNDGFTTGRKAGYEDAQAVIDVDIQSAYNRGYTAGHDDGLAQEKRNTWGRS